MTRWTLAGLVVLNILLAVGVYSRLGGEQKAYGQIGAAKDYVTVMGANLNDPVVYVLEAGTGRLVAIRTSIIDRRITLSAARNITADFQRLR